MKLLVCDDDISTIDVIESQLNTQELGISQVYRAYNGQMAKEIIDREDPELILCDIDMPICNGIEVLKYACGDGKEREFSFLTCYEEFEYARIAIQYGVTGYLTKPFDPEEVRVCIQKMIANARKKKEKEEPASQKQYDTLMSSIFRQACEGYLGTDRDIVEAALKINGAEFSADSRWRICGTCTDMSEAAAKGWNTEMLRFMMAQLHDEVILSYIGTAHTVVNLDERYLWAFCFVQDDREPEELRQKAQELITFVQRYTSLHPAAAISDPFCFYDACDMTYTMYEQLRQVRHRTGQVFFTSEITDDHACETVIFSRDLILWYMKNRDEAGYREYIRLTAEDLRSDRDRMERFRSDLIHLYAQHFRDNRMSTNDIFRDQEILRLQQASPVTDRILTELAERLWQLQQNRMKESAEEEDVIARAKKYIDENFREDISRSDIAAMTYVTPNYLSKLFKNNMNMNLREYINKLRIEEAKRLLLSTALPVSEIASQVGYYNISYFSTVFHKLVGVSPYDWRSRGGE